MRPAATHIRNLLLVGGILTTTLAVASTTLTNAAWTDDEYVHGGAGTDGRCEQDSGTTTLASARQLTGTLMNTNLDSLAALEGVSVTNDGAGTSTANSKAIRINQNTFMAALDASAVNTNLLQLSLPLGLPVGSADAYTQWSQTLNNGNATAAAGLVTDSGGALGLGQPQDPANPPVTATLDLGAIVPASLAGITLDVGAVSSMAVLDYCGDLGNGWQGPLPQATADRSYQVSSLELNADLPAVQATVAGSNTLLQGLTTSLQAAQPRRAAAVVHGLTTAAVPLLGTLDPLAAADIKTEVKLDLTKLDTTAAHALLTTTMTDSSGLVTVDFGTGVVQVDLAHANGTVYGLNGRAPNTPVILDQAIRTKVLEALTRVLASWQAQLSSAVTEAVRAVPAIVTASVNVRSAGLHIATVSLGMGPVNTGELLDLHYRGSGSAAVPVTPHTELVGLNLPTATLDALATGLASALPGITGRALHDELILGSLGTLQTSVGQVMNPVAPALASAMGQVAALLSVTVNVQPDQAGYPDPAEPNPFSVTALRISLPSRSLELSFATSSVAFGSEKAPAP